MHVKWTFESSHFECDHSMAVSFSCYCKRTVPTFQGTLELACLPRPTTCYSWLIGIMEEELHGSFSFVCKKGVLREGILTIFHFKMVLKRTWEMVRAVNGNNDKEEGTLVFQAVN